MNDTQNVKRQGQGDGERKGGSGKKGPISVVTGSPGQSGDTGQQIASFLEANWQKSGFFIILLGALVWFALEYRSAQALRNEEASLAYSNVMSLFGKVTGSKEVADGTNDGDDTAKTTEQLNRFLDESQRISKEFDDTAYGKLAGIMRATVTTENAGASADSGNEPKLLPDELKDTGKILESNPMDVLGSELGVLTQGRIAAFSEDAAMRSSGQEKLKSLINNAGVYSVEAAVSLAVSYITESAEKNLKVYGPVLKDKEYFKLLDKLVSKNPAAENALVAELTRFGISYEFGRAPANDSMK